MSGGSPAKAAAEGALGLVCRADTPDTVRCRAVRSFPKWRDPNKTDSHLPPDDPATVFVENSL